MAKHDLVHFVADRRNQAAEIYLLGGAASHILSSALIPLAAITVLGSALNVGGFNTVFAIAGALALLAVGSRRRPENRLLILGLSSIVLIALNLMLGYSLTIVTLVVYTIGTSIMQPISRVSQHVIDLKTMDGMAHSASDFYPAMILRDVALVGVAHGGGGAAAGFRGGRGDGAGGDFARHVFDRRGNRCDIRRRLDAHRVEAVKLHLRLPRGRDAGAAKRRRDRAAA